MNVHGNSQGRGGGPPAHAGGPHGSGKGGFPPGIAKNMDKLPSSNPWKQKFLAEEAENAKALEAEKAAKEAEQKEAEKLEAETVEKEESEKAVQDANTAIAKAAITGETTPPVSTAVNTPVITVPLQTQAEPITLIQDTTFLGQSIDPNSAAGRIAMGATATPIVQTGDPVADRINGFLRTTNILLASTGSQAVG